MTEDFQMVKEAVTIGEVVTALGLEKGKSNYYFPDERTPSIKIYPENNSFFDFGRSAGGDVVKLWSHVRGCNQWQAVKEMQDFFNIQKPNKTSKAEIREKIRQQQAEQQARIKAKKEEKKDFALTIDFYKQVLSLIELWENTAKIPPFSNIRKALSEEKNRINMILDDLVGVG